MKQIIHKTFWLWEYDKEEAWLNEMSRKGLQLTQVGLFRYVFEKDPSHCYYYRLEMLNRFDGDYIPFLEGTGIEYLCRLKNWAYFRKDTAQGEFQLYSDVDSKLHHLNRILVLILALLAFALSFLVYGIGLWWFHANREPWGLALPLLYLGFSALLCQGLYNIRRKQKKLAAQKAVSE